MPDTSRQIAVSCHQLPRQTELVVQPEGWYLLLLLLLTPIQLTSCYVIVIDNVIHSADFTPACEIRVEWKHN